MQLTNLEGWEVEQNVHRAGATFFDPPTLHEVRGFPI